MKHRVVNTSCNKDYAIYWRRVLKYRFFSDLNERSLTFFGVRVVQITAMYCTDSAKPSSSSEWTGKNNIHIQRFNVFPVSFPCKAEMLQNLCCILPSNGSFQELQPQSSLSLILTLMTNRNPIDEHHLPLACGRFYIYYFKN